MSHKEAQQVLDHAVYRGGKLFLLYRVANLVNSHNGFEYWQRPQIVADELRMTPGTVRKYMSAFVDDGWFGVIEHGGGRGKSTRYVWTFTPTDTAPVGAVSETAPGVKETAPHVNETAPKQAETAPGVNPLLYTEKTEKGRKQERCVSDETAPTEMRRTYSEAFNAFWADYGRFGVKSEADDEWKKLAPTDRRDAHRFTATYLASIPSYQETPKHAARYLKKRVWDNYIDDDGNPIEVAVHRTTTQGVKSATSAVNAMLSRNKQTNMPKELNR